MIINKSKLVELETFASPTSKDYPEKTFKNFRLEKAMEYMNLYCRDVVMSMNDSILENKKFKYVDVKVHDLNPGDNTANGLWHLDSSLNYGPYYENYLFVTGMYNLTEFVDGEIEIGEHQSSKTFSDEVETKVKETKRIKSNTITRYYGDNIHRGVKCEKPEKRLLIRLINTDQRLPSYGFEK